MLQGFEETWGKAGIPGAGPLKYDGAREKKKQKGKGGKKK